MTSVTHAAVLLHDHHQISIPLTPPSPPYPLMPLTHLNDCFPLLTNITSLTPPPPPPHHFNILTTVVIIQIPPMCPRYSEIHHHSHPQTNKNKGEKQNGVKEKSREEKSREEKKNEGEKRYHLYIIVAYFRII